MLILQKFERQGLIILWVDSEQWVALFQEILDCLQFFPCSCSRYGHQFSSFKLNIYNIIAQIIFKGLQSSFVPTIVPNSQKLSLMKQQYQPFSFSFKVACLSTYPSSGWLKSIYFVLLLWPIKQCMRYYCRFLLNQVSFQIVYQLFLMGNKCFQSTPYKSYSHYLGNQSLVSLKEHWSPINLFKLKKIFESNCQLNQKTQKCLHYKSFISLFPQLANEHSNFYQEKHRIRLFHLFNRKSEEDGITWNDFFQGLTLCYFGSQEILSILLFATFDDKLDHTLSKNQLWKLLIINSKYLQQQTETFDIIDDETALAGLMLQKEQISIDEWIVESPKYVYYQKYRKIFNIFIEEELQKQLVQNYSDLNNLYNQQKNKYIGYLINYKWFQTWKTYISKVHNIQINGYSSNLTYSRTQKSIKSIRTKKSIKSSKSIKSIKSINSGKSNKKIADLPRLKEIQFERDNQLFLNRQYNLIYNNLGDKPTQIYNNLLEGEYSQILTPQLVENINYVIVSEEVWKRLKMIYGAYPEFRRSGEKTIQIYPKNFKIYSKFHRGRILYDEQKICQFSNYMQIDVLISKILQINCERLDQFRIFFKTCSTFKWEFIKNLKIKTSDISSEQIIFLAAVPNQQSEQFIRHNCQNAENIKEIHIGDQLIYSDPLERISRKAYYMGTRKNKIIIHFKGLSYIYDICVQRQIFLQNAILCKKAIDNSKSRVKTEDLGMVGLPYTKGLGFINSLIICLLSCQQLNRLLQSLFKQQILMLVDYLAYISHMITNRYNVDTICISDMIRSYFFQYSNFDLTMCEEFIDEFMEQVYKSFQNEIHHLFQNPIHQYLIEIEKNVTCQSCGKSTKQKLNFFSFTLTIPDEEVRYYEIRFVPYAFNLKSVQIKRYGFSLPINSTFKQYKLSFQKVSQIKSNSYFLAQVHGNNIIKNYINAKEQATLRDLLLRQDDAIYAYQFCFKLDNFVNDHYCGDFFLKFKNLKVGQMIDFEKEKNLKKASLSKKKIKFDGDRRNENKGQNQKQWICGKITKIDKQKYTYKWILQVQHRQNRHQRLISVLNPEKINFAIFPTKSYQFAEQFHIRLINRIYNEVANEMQLCNIPLVFMIAGWMRIKEVQLLVYQQVRGFISDNYKFHVNEDGFQEEGQLKMSKKEKMKKFREYLYQGNKPYTIVFTDLEGRCAKCCKMQKSQILQNQESYICDGCEIDPQTPIFWQIRPYQTRICVDWISLDSFVKPLISDHASYISTKSARKNCKQQLNHCMMHRLKILEENEQCSCSVKEVGISYKQKILNSPGRLIFMFDRLIDQEGDYKSINRKYIYFQIEELMFNKEAYQLVAAISIEGSHGDAKFISYIRSKNSWLQYIGEHVRVVKKNVVQKICALTLFYKKIQVEKKIINDS